MSSSSKKRLLQVVAVIIIVMLVAGGTYFYTLSTIKPSQPPLPTDLTTFVWREMHDPSSLDPAVVFDGSSREIYNTYETLSRLDSNSNAVPVLATSWEVSTDGLTWTYHLRDNVKFQDGTPFNASAVKFSFERTMTINKGAAYILSPIKEMQILDPLTIRFVLKYPQPLDLIMSSLYGAYIVSPTAVKLHEQNGDLAQAWMGENAVGTGPYKLESWTHEQQLVYTKFDDYWRGWEGNHVDKVLIKIVREATSAIMMIGTGEIDDTGYQGNLEDVAAFGNRTDMKLDINPTFTVLYIRMNMLKKPLDDKRVRQAISYAFPYKDAVDKIYLGYADQARGPLPKGLWGYDENAFQYSHDLDKAKQLLTEAGYPNGGFTLDFYYYTGDEQVRKMADLLVENLGALGITVNTRVMPFTTLLTMATNPDTAPHLSVHEWWPTYPDPFDYLYGMFHSSQIGIFDWSNYNNTEYDQLIEQANVISATDRTQAIQLYKQAQAIVIDDAPALFIWQIKDIGLTRTWVHGLEYNINYYGHYDFYKVYKAV
jgi:peptide/nickel transport system substrate-binding protein